VGGDELGDGEFVSGGELDELRREVCLPYGS
jgi:hypothetical protein